MKSEKMGEQYRVFISDDGSYQFAVCDLSDKNNPTISIVPISFVDLIEMVRLIEHNKQMGWP